MHIDSLNLLASALIQAGRHKEALNAINIGLILHPRNPLLIDLFSKIPAQYDQAFFNDSYEVSFRSAELYLNNVSHFYMFDMVIDVGAGAGAWSHAAINAGKKVVSVDGEWVKGIKKQCDTLCYFYQDLNNSLSLPFYGDLAICVEVAEHLHPERSASFVRELCLLAPAVLFGAALPRQGGSGHINCRPHSFWIALFAENNYVPLDPFRSKFWYDGRVGPWYAQNTFLFIDKRMKASFNSIPEPSLVNVYHPRVVVDSPICIEDHLGGSIDPGDEKRNAN